jgi:hypothetical protein
MSGAGGTPPPTRIISWEQQVLEADPYFARERQQPWIYTFSNARRFYAPVNAYAPLPDDGLENNGGVLWLIGDAGYPDATSAAYLPPGAVWDNGGSIAVVPGGVYQAGVRPMFFGSITASQLMLFGGGSLPTSNPNVVNQLWNNGGEIAVSTGILDDLVDDQGDAITDDSGNPIEIA